MTDRELLEKAALAVGLGVKWEHGHGCFWIEMGQGLPINPWNPLTDSAQAFELMVRLEIDLCVSIGGHACAGCPPVVNYIEVPLGSDPAASTRRAITRAAAAIQNAREARDA